MRKGFFTIMVYHNATLPASPSSMVAVTTPRVLMWLSIAASNVVRFICAIHYSIMHKDSHYVSQMRNNRRLNVSPGSLLTF